MIKSKKQMFIVIGVFALVMLLGTVTYAFFNYTRTGASNNIKVGRISFVSRDEETITLNNLFPIDPENTTDMNDTTKVGTYQITIEGDTDYSGGIEYLVSTTNSNLSNLPISINMTAGNGLGTNDTNYFTTRDTATTPIYKKIVGSEIVGDQMLLVGFIPQNTTLGTSDETGDVITIKAYLDKNKILISDTYDGTESDNMGTQNSLAQGKTVLTTTEWNSLSSTGVSFKIKVEANEGIWVKGSLEEIMKKDAVMDNVNSTYVDNTTPGINFGAVSGDTNGKGVYMRAGTENDAYPIMYYRGAVEDNNVMFANQCWKAVRTTDTGGVKLIYNGSASNYYSREFTDVDTYLLENEKYPFTFNETNKTFDVSIDDSDGTTLEFKVPSGSDYSFVLSGTATSQGSVSIALYKDGVSVNGTGGGGGGSVSLTHNFGTLTSDNVIKMIVTGTATQSSPSTLSVKMQQNSSDLTKGSYSVLSLRDTGALGCDNSGPASQITVNNTNTFTFSSSYNSPAYVGYMYGDVYTSNSEAATSGAYYGSGFTYSNGVYTLTNTSTTKDGTHHYTCNSTNAEGTCATIRYYYYNNYYINLTGGDGIEQALTKMQTNTNDSIAKEKIDTWYASNMTSYTNKLEDTIWCNDRSMGDNNNNGWIANGGDLSTYLYYGAHERSNYASNTSTVKNQPSLACANKNDRFTVNNGNGNGALDYPVALLTEDEMVLAGGLAGSSSSFYLNNGSRYYWSLSPNVFESSSAIEFFVGFGDIYYNGHVDRPYGLRPSVSLKPGTPVVSGTGTVADPYVIE